MLPARVSDTAALTRAEVGALPADDQAASRAPELADVRTYVRTYGSALVGNPT